VATLVLERPALVVTARSRIVRELAPWLYLAPALLCLGLFVYWPVVWSLWLSVHRWDFLAESRPFVGLANYRELVGSGEFHNALERTFLFTLFTVPLRLGLALLLAQLLVEATPLRRLARAVLFAPYATSGVAVALVWSWIFNADVGLANALLRALGAAGLPWLTSTDLAILSVAIVAVWKSLGYDVVVFTAGLAAIPRDVHEAASLDGAGRFARFRYVTVPLLMPTTFFLLCVMVIDSFQTFTLVAVMTRGGPAWSTDLLVHLLYRTSFVYFEIGRGAALAIVLFVGLLFLTWLQFRTIGRRIHYGGDR
jgi:multiple sugar transport system permease protein/sn-glycerol 3-phosphate transport system permease protein